MHNRTAIERTSRRHAHQAIYWREHLVAALRAFLGQTAGVPVEHLRTCPAGQADDVLLVSPVAQAHIRPRAPEEVWMHALDTRLYRTLTDSLVDAAIRQGLGAAQPIGVEAMNRGLL